LFALWIHPELRGIFGEAMDIEINHGLVWPSSDNAAKTTDSDSDILPEEEPGYDSQEEGERENPDDVGSFDRREVWIDNIKDVQTGVSLGIESRKDSLGGLLRLEVGSDTLELAITNNHVVFGNSTTSRRSLCTPMLLPNSIVAVNPSDGDARYLGHAFRREIRYLNKTLRKPGNKVIAMFDQRLKASRDRDAQEQEMKRIDLKIMNEFSRKLGKLYAASGLRSKKIASISTPTGLGLEIDWARVRVTEGQNLVSFTPRHTYLKFSLEAAVAL
jgi:hypothetical protein